LVKLNYVYNPTHMRAFKHKYADTKYICGHKYFV